MAHSTGRDDTLRALFEPARYPAPALDGWQSAWRYALAGLGYLLYVGVVLVSASEAPSASSGARPGTIVIGYNGESLAGMPTWLVVVDLVVGLGSLWLIRYRRRWPLGVYLVLETLSLVSNSIAVVAVWSFLSMASRRRLPQIGMAITYTFVVGVLAVTFVPWHQRDLQPFQGAGVWGLVAVHLTSLIFLALAAPAGMYYGTRQDRLASVRTRADNADRDRELAVLGERNRIAREMHDVLAHRISVVAMHAGALSYRDNLTPDEVRTSAEVIAENAQASLTELRGVLAGLREGQVGADGVPLPPQPTLDDLDGLLAEASRLGQRVSLVRDWADAVPAATSRHGFRIVQECLTNARKHAPGCPVALSVVGGPDAGLTIHCANPMPAAGVTPGAPGAGLGLLGVRERADMLGGRFFAGPVEGEFVVACHLPWPRSGGLG